MEEMIIGLVDQFGYAGIVLLIALENIFPPIPSEVILTFGGFLTTYTSLNIWGVIFAATIGSVIGAVILYCVGRFFGQERLMKLVDGRLGKILHFNHGDVAHALEWFLKKGRSAVFFCRCVPIVRSLISIPAGMSGMSMGHFMLLTVLGTIVWNVVLVHLGAFAGASWGIVTHYIDTYKNAAILILVAALIGICIFVRRRKKTTGRTAKK